MGDKKNKMGRGGRAVSEPPLVERVGEEMLIDTASLMRGESYASGSLETGKVMSLINPNRYVTPAIRAEERYVLQVLQRREAARVIREERGIREMMALVKRTEKDDLDNAMAGLASLSKYGDDMARSSQRLSDYIGKSRDIAERNKRVREVIDLIKGAVMMTTYSSN